MPVKYIQIRLTSSAFSTLDRLSTELEQACQDNFVNVSNEWLQSRERSRDDIIVDLLANDVFEPTDIFGIPFYEEAKLTLKLKIQRLNTLDRQIVLTFDTEAMGLSAYDASRFRKVETEYAIIKYSDNNINSQFRIEKYEQDLIFRPERLQLTTEGGTYKSYPAHADLCLNGDRTDIETTFSCQDGCFMTGLQVDDLYNPRTVDIDTRRDMMLLRRTPQREPQRRDSNWGGGNDNNNQYRPGRRRYGSGQCQPGNLFTGYRDPDDDDDWQRRREAERMNGAVSRLRPVRRQGADAVTPSQLRREGESRRASGSQRPEIPKLPQLSSGVEYKVGAVLRDEDRETGCWGLDDVKPDQKKVENDQSDQDDAPDPGEANFALPNAVANQVMLHGNWTDDQMEILSFTRNEASKILKPPEIKNWLNSIKRNTYMSEDTKSIYSDIIQQDDEVSVAKVMDTIVETFTDKCSVAHSDKESLSWFDFDTDVKQRSSSPVDNTEENVLTDSMRGTTVVRGGVMAQGAWAQGPPRPPTPGSQWTPRHQGPAPYRGRGTGSSRGSVASPRPGYRPYDGQGGRGYQGHAGGQEDRNYEPSRGRGSPRGTPRGPPSVSPSRSWSDRTSQRPGPRSPVGSMSPPMSTEPLKPRVERINTEDYEDEEIRNEKWIKSRIPNRFLDERRGGYVTPTHETYTSDQLLKFYRKKLTKENRKVAALVYHRVFLLNKCYLLMLTLYVRGNQFVNNELEEAIENQDRGVRIAFNVAEREIAQSEAQFVSFVMSQGEAILILLKHLCSIVRKRLHLMTDQDIFDVNWARGAVVCHQIRNHDGFLQIYQDQVEVSRYKIKLAKKRLQSYPNSACSLLPPGPIPSELANDLHELQQSEGLIQDEQPKEGKKGKKQKVKNSPALGGEGKKDFSASALVNKFLNHDNRAEEKVEEMEKELKEFEEKLKPQGYKAKIDTYFFLLDSANDVNNEGKFEKLKRQRLTIVAEVLMMNVCCINADAMKYKDTRLMERSETAEQSPGDDEQARTSPESEEKGEKAKSSTEVAEPMEVTEPIDPSKSLVTMKSPNDMVMEVTGNATDVVMGNGVSPDMANSQLDGAMGSPGVADENLKNGKGKTNE